MSTQTTNLGLTKPAGNERPRINPINGNMDILDAAIGDVDVSQDGSLQSQIDALGESVTFINVPYANFTWNSNGNRFVTSSYTIPSGYTVVGIMTTPTNGGAILQGYIMNSSLSVVGWVPGNSSSLTSDYQFTCYLICSKNV